MNRTAMTPAAAVRLVAGRELNTRLRTRGFLISTAVILIAMAGYVLLQSALVGNADRTEVGLAGQATAVAGPLETGADGLGMTVTTREVASAADGRTAVADGELDALVSGSAADLRVVVKTELDPQLHALLDGISQQEVLNAELAATGQDPETVMQDVNATHVQVTTIEEPNPEQGQRIAVALVMMVLLYMSLVLWGTTVAQGVVEEKSSRVVEILLSAVRPWHLLLGKVVGLGLVGLAQLTILGVAGLAMASAAGVLTVTGVATSTLLWGIVWYLLGFFLYATVFAGAGSLVSRQEDMQSVLTPITIVLIGGFIAGVSVLQTPDSTAAQVMSLVPPLSPILMPSRIATGAATPLEIGVALVLTIATIAALTWLGGKVYQAAILRTGSRVRLMDTLKRS